MLFFIEFRWLDMIDILLIAFLLYQLYHIVKGTPAIKIFVGILAIYIFWQIVKALQMDLLSEVLGQFIGVGVIALIIVFQQELRRFLLVIGNTGFSELPLANRWLKFKRKEETSIDIKTLVTATKKLAQDGLGALIVIGKTSDLTHIAKTGDALHAKLSTRLLETIFFKNSPLHDGAVIIVENEIIAAHCVLPVSNDHGDKSLGMRHRSALGCSESTDAVVLIVSEERGEISIAQNGQLHGPFDGVELKNELSTRLA